MYFVLVALWLIACVMACLLKRAQHRNLTRACPCVAAGGLLLAIALYFANYHVLAIAILVASGYITMTILWSIVIQNREAKRI